MHHRLSLPLLLSACACAAQAAEVPKAEVPAPIRAALTNAAEAEEAILDGITGWEMDLEGDGTTEWLVQAAYAFPGGNAVYVRTFFFDGADSGYGAQAETGFGRSIKRVAFDPPVITLTLFELLDGDPRCCPTGESTRTITIGESPDESGKDR